MSEGFNTQPRSLSEQEKEIRAVENESKIDRILPLFFYVENGEKIPFIPDALVAISGSIVEVAKKDGVQTREGYKGFKTPSYKDVDNKGYTSGAKARVLASAEAYQYFPNIPVITTSRDSNTESERPTHAAVMSHELLSYEVLKKDILVEEQSISTLTNLIGIIHQAQTSQPTLQNFALITNEYHLPRMQKMIELLPTLIDGDDIQTQEEIAAFFKADKKLIPIAAEGILEVRDRRYAMLFAQVKHSEAYQKRLTAEAQGVTDLVEGKYTKNLPSSH